MLFEPDINLGVCRTEPPLEQFPAFASSSQECLAFSVESALGFCFRILCARVIDLLAVGPDWHDTGEGPVAGNAQMLDAKNDLLPEVLLTWLAQDIHDRFSLRAASRRRMRDLRGR